MATQDEMRKFVPKTGATGQVDVSFEHERRGSSSPAEKMDGDVAVPVIYTAARTAPSKRTEHDH